MSDTTRHHRFAGLAAAGILALAAAGTAQAHEAKPNDGLNATYWTQKAVEYKANSYGLYMLAEVRLDQGLADKKWTALTAAEQGDGYEGKPPAVILDLDETVMDNSGYQAWTVKANTGFSGKTWTEYVNSETSGAIPGSLEFIKYAVSKGVAVFYISNRKDFEEKATIANLKALGYPVDDSGANVLTRGEKEEWKKSAKSPRRMAVAATHRVLLNIGDNLADFTDDSDGTPDERLAVYKKNQDMWGKQWIMIANPTYGSWEGASFGFQWKLSDDEKRDKKIDGLDAWVGPK